MTFVAAQIFGQRILMIADTKISDPNGTLRRVADQPHAHNYIPGRLKCSPLNLRLSVAYAGRSGKALSVLRSIRREMSEAAFDLEETIDCLRLGSEDGTVDFLLISHIYGVEIYKISNGLVSLGHPFQWIGDKDVVPDLSASIERVRVRRGEAALNGHSIEIDPDYGTVDEHDFQEAWSDLLLRSPTLSDSVGGIPITILGSPYGHSFLTGAGAYYPGTLVLTSQGVFDEEGREIDPILAQYSYSLVGSAERGAPILGLWVQETHSAYLYDPMLDDEAQITRPTTIEQLSTVVTQRAMELGGVKVDY